MKKLLVLLFLAGLGSSALIKADAKVYNYSSCAAQFYVSSGDNRGQYWIPGKGACTIKGDINRFDYDVFTRTGKISDHNIGVNSDRIRLLADGTAQTNQMTDEQINNLESTSPSSALCAPRD